jgi:hypothetical protein
MLMMLRRWTKCWFPFSKVLIPIRAKNDRNILSWFHLYPATNNPIVAAKDADPGEFTAFLNGKLDLSQAAVADLTPIMKPHQIAMQQMRGDLSKSPN